MRKLSLGLVALALLVLVIFLAGRSDQRRISRPPAEPVFCTQDAKQCPDGSYVSRVPPTCDFVACPVEVGEKITVQSEPQFPPDQTIDVLGNRLAQWASNVRPAPVLIAINGLVINEAVRLANACPKIIWPPFAVKPKPEIRNGLRFIINRGSCPVPFLEQYTANLNVALAPANLAAGLSCLGQFEFYPQPCL